MNRAVSLIAVLCTGIALGALLLAVAGGNRERGLPAEPPLLDPAAALPEIAELRQARGSILAGTTLAASEEPGEFSAALASHTGVEAPPPSHESLIERLRRSAQEYDEHAQRYETQERYAEADQLRQLGAQTRQLARRLSPK
jgi:hypothetical protein